MIVQPVPERAQVAGEGSVTLPAPVWEKVTVSPEIVPDAPDTVAVQLEVTPTVAGVHETETLVVAAVLVTVTLAVPELAVLLASPGYDA